MSEYGQIWEEIRVVRVKLADALGVPVASLHRLAGSIRLAADRKRQVDLLLAIWAELEEKAAKLDPDSGNQRSGDSCS